MQLQKRQALKLAIEQTDRHWGEYRTTESQNNMLAALVHDHSLMDTKDIQLTVAQYRKWVNEIASKNAVALTADAKKTQQVFTRGSTVLKEEFLDEIGWANQHLQSADHADEDGEDRKESESPVKTSAQPQDHSKNIDPLDSNAAAEVSSTSHGQHTMSQSKANAYSSGSITAGSDAPSMYSRKRGAANLEDPGQPEVPSKKPKLRSELEASKPESESIAARSRVRRSSRQDHVGTSRETIQRRSVPSLSVVAGGEPASEGRAPISDDSEPHSGQHIQTGPAVASSSTSSPAGPSPNQSKRGALERPAVEAIEEESVRKVPRLIGQSNVHPEHERVIAPPNVSQTFGPSETVQLKSKEPTEASANTDSTSRAPMRKPLQFGRMHTGLPAKTAEVQADYIKRLDGDEVRNAIDAMWYSIDNFGWSMLRTGDENASDRCETAQLIPRPSAELETLYKRIFGSEWKERGFALLSQTHPLDNQQLVAACLGAAAYELIWEQELPWKGPKEVQADLADQQYLFDILLFQAKPQQTLRLNETIWNVGLLLAGDKEFQDTTIRPVAENLAKEFLITLKPQLDLLGLPLAKDNAEELMQHSIKRVAKIFTEAMILKGKIRAAPQYYRCVWIDGGTEFDSYGMREVYPYHEGVTQEVRWCVSPKLEVRMYTDREWELTCPAWVITRDVPSAEPANRAARQ